MQSDHIIQRALRDVHDLLLANVAPRHSLSDKRTVLFIHVAVGKDEVRRALEKASDTALCFLLKEVKQVLADKSQPHKATINCLWRIIERPNFREALGIRQH